jgi:hypothetical protein
VSDSVKELNKLLDDTKTAGDAEAQRAARSLARSVDISPGTFAGRERDALPSLTGVAAYYKLSQRAREGVLRYTAETFGMGHPFFHAVQGVAAAQLVQPAWFKTNLSNKELLENAVTWGIVRKVVNLIALGAGSTYAVDRVAGGGISSGENVMKRDWKAIKDKMISGGQLTARQGRILGMGLAGIFAAAVLAIANAEADAMIEEIHERIERGQLTWDDKREVEKKIADATNPLTWVK